MELQNLLNYEKNIIELMKMFKLQGFFDSRELQNLLNYEKNMIELKKMFKW